MSEREKSASSVSDVATNVAQKPVLNSPEKSVKSAAFAKPKSSATRLALYRKYRPKSLSEIVGQPQVTDILDAASQSKNFAHAYLLTGQRGTGKTSLARILAHLINETTYDLDEKEADLDIIEIDAASRGSVDDARELREKSAIAPIRSKHKIYIIDEVHMLSTPAFNALLKIIEEPPEHIVFILATTELQKVPATILSRVQRFHFRPVAPEIVAKHLRKISDQEEITIDDEALLLIAQRGEGSFRDAISLLDQLSNSNQKITRQSVEEILGLAPETAITAIIDAISDHNAKIIVETLNNLFKEGLSPSLIVNQLLSELEKLAPEKPKLYSLIEKLLEVAKSAAPGIKLTAILAMAATSGSAKTVAAAVVALPKVDSNEKLATIIEKKIEKEKVEKAKDASKMVDETPPTEASNPKKSADENTKDLAESTNSQNDDVTLPAEISWPDVLQQIQNSDQPAILATAKFADPDYANGRVTLYFTKSFHRKKAETAKFRAALATAISELYNATPEITIAATAVRADSDTARILDIMGGGEVVKSPNANDNSEENHGKA